MNRVELLAEMLRERFPSLEVMEMERPPTPEEIERRRRILLGEKRGNG